jgi:hypothetical protein
MRFQRIAILTLTLTTMSAGAQAAIITFDFTAVQILTSGTGTIADLAEGFLNISGSFSYDTSVAPSSSTSSTATYPTGGLTINEFSLASGTYLGSPVTAVDNGSVISDELQIYSGPVGGSIGFFDFWEVDLYDVQGTAFSSAALPTALALGMFEGRTLLFLSYEGLASASPTTGYTQFEFTSLTLRETSAPIPEPATLLLLGTGLAAAGVRRRMKKRS